MKRLAPALALCALAGAMVALPEQGTARPPAPPHMRPGVGSANPSGLVAVEMAMAKLARDKGLWRALRDNADDEAILLAPLPSRTLVLAKDWLKEQGERPNTFKWGAHQIWMSCDGSLGVTKGAWHNDDGTTGTYTTIWKRQKKGDFRWVLTQSAPLTQPLDEPDMLTAVVADCTGPRQPPMPDGSIVVEGKGQGEGLKDSGRSQDGSLIWSYRANADNSRSLSVSLRKNGQMQPIIHSDAAHGEL